MFQSKYTPFIAAIIVFVFMLGITIVIERVWYSTSFRYTMDFLLYLSQWGILFRTVSSKKSSKFK